MARAKPFNLFTYGTLTSPWVFRAVLGRRLAQDCKEADGVESFCPRPAILDGYKLISPDNTYLYAVPDSQGRVRGYVVGPLPAECMKQLRRYEGRNYRRRVVRVHIGTGDQQAVAFVGNARQLEHSFGYEFDDHFKQEVLLDKKIDAALLETEQEQLHTDEETTRRALAELRGDTIRDLRRRHFEAGGISDYAIRHSLLDVPLPTYGRIVAETHAQALANNYLTMVMRQVLFNQFEDRIHQEFRYELDQMGLGEAYYERTISSLTALRLINGSRGRVGRDVLRGLKGLRFQRDELLDYVRRAVWSAESLFDARQARAELSFIAHHMARGYVPLGAELEFSNIGHGVIRDPQATVHCDRQYDGFFYFYDFALDVLTWKLGGHIDDHRDKAPGRSRRGFFEVALGNLSIQANISKPVTDDPWVLNQLIHETMRFYDVAPHSVHISMQLRSQQQPVLNRSLPLPVMKCLFAIAGNPDRAEDGRIVIRRLVSDEIVRQEGRPHILFTEITRRHSWQGDDAQALPHPPGERGRYVQQYKFLRLSPKLNYEPMVVALKGLQIHFRPGTFLTAPQHGEHPKLGHLLGELLAWGARPGPLEAEEQGEFLTAVYEGLITERRGRPAHSDAYISWSLDQLDQMLKAFNRAFETGGAKDSDHISGQKPR